MTRCPRCLRESPRPTAYCAGCGAPLLLGDDAHAAPLDAPLDLDRRHGDRGPDGPTVASIRPLPAPPAAPPLPRSPGVAEHRDELAAVERSHWDLRMAGPVAAAAEERDASGAPEVPDAEVDRLEVHVRRAEGWRRGVAWLVDGLPFLAGSVALARRLVREAAAGLPPVAGGIDGLLDLLARERVIALSVAAAAALALVVYATLAHALAGATLGKRLLGLRVVGPDGARPSPARSAVRSALAVASALLLGLGFVAALFTRSGRALHDVLARTWVVKAP